MQEWQFVQDCHRKNLMESEPKNKRRVDFDKHENIKTATHRQ
jgi:hypothetical protein